LASDVAQARRDRDDTWLGGHRPKDDRYDARSSDYPRVLLATAYEMIEQFRHFGCWHIASFRCAAEFGRYQGRSKPQQSSSIL
jgi:hypothetical protein